MKIASIGQAIMQAARPRVLLVPLQFGLGVQMHHHFGSRFLIDAFHCHRQCGPQHISRYGMIVVITPEHQCTEPISRVKVTCKDVAIVRRVPIHFHKEERLGTGAIMFENLFSFKA